MEEMTQAPAAIQIPPTVVAMKEDNMNTKFMEIN
jgi:hypothetical protein